MDEAAHVCTGVPLVDGRACVGVPGLGTHTAHMSEHHSGSHWGTGAGDASDIGGREEAGVMDTLRAALQDALAGSGEARQSSSEEGRDEACRAGGEEDSDEVGGAGGAGGGEVQGTEAALRVTRWMERASGKGGGPPPQLAFRTSSAKWVAFVAELTEADGSVLRQPLAGAGAALLLALLVEAELADAALLTQLLGAHSPEAAAMLTVRLATRCAARTDPDNCHPPTPMCHPMCHPRRVPHAGPAAARG